MKPYLRIFFSHIYSLDICERNNSACELSRQLKRFYDYNPHFGRKLIRLKNGRKTNWHYNDKHIEFRGKNYSLNYKNSHLEFEETTIIHDIIGRIPTPQQEHHDTPELSGVSDESDSESESESENDDNENDNDDYDYDYSIRVPPGTTGHNDASNLDNVESLTRPEGESEPQQNSEVREEWE
jgi:hypothetical protein